MSRAVLGLHDRELVYQHERQGAPVTVPLPQSVWRCSQPELAAAFAALPRPTRGPRRAALQLPLSGCLVHAIAVEQRRPAAALLRYTFEEFIPTDVDDYHCAFKHTTGSTYIGVALARVQLEQLVQAAGGGGWRVDRVGVGVPRADDPHGDLLVCDADHWWWARFSAGRLQTLRVLRFVVETPLAERARQLCAALPERERPLELLIENPTRDDGDLIAALRAVDIATIPHSRHSDRWKYFDLAVDDPQIGGGGLRARRQQRFLGAALGSLALVALALGVGLTRLKQARAALQHWERDVYAQVFPDEPIPNARALRLQAARRALDAAPAWASPLTDQGAAPLGTLFELLARLPADLRLRIEELRLDGRTLVLRGQTRDHADAERIAQALDAAPAIRCPAPRSDRLREGGVRFSLIASIDEDFFAVRGS